MALLSQANKLIVVLVVVIALLALIVGIFIGGPLAAISLDTETKTWNWYAFQGYGLNPNGQLLDASQYVTSWSTSYDSEKIVVRAGVTRAFGALSCMDGVRYQIWVTSNGLTWTETSDSPLDFSSQLPNVNQGGGQPIALPGPTYTFKGPFTGGIKVDMQGHIKDVAAGCFGGLDKGWLTLAEDQAYLVPGVGKINAPQQAQVGDTITVSTVVGYVTSELDTSKGWQFWGYSYGQAKIVLGPVILSSLQQTFTYTLKAADFSVSAGCTTPNRIEWHLLNELYEKDFAFTTTIDVSKLAPSMSITGYDGDPVNGGNVTLHFTSAPNPVALFPIQKIVVAYGFGGIQNEANLTGNVTSYPVSLGQSGNLHVEAYAVDSACRPSPSQRIDISVREPGQPPGSGVKPNWLIFGVILAVFILAAIVAALAWKGGPIWARLLVLAVIVLVGLVIAIVAVPAVLNPLAYLIRLVIP